MRYLPNNKRRDKNTPLILIRDTREQKPWRSDFETVTKKLATGDYSFYKFEDIVAIERKYNLKELYTDLSGNKRSWFLGVLNRLSNYPVRCIIIEDNFENYIKTLRYIPKTRLTQDTIPYWINEIMFSYNIPILFVGKSFRKSKDILNRFLLNLFEQARKI